MKRRAAMDIHRAGHPQQQTQTQSYKIHVKMLKTVTLDVNCTDTVDQIKSKFSAIEGIDKNAQELFFAGIHLKNENSLADYDIMTNSSVDLYVTDGIQISVKIPSAGIGKTIKLNVKKSNTVADVKALIKQEEGTLVDEQILLYAGRQLEDNQMLSQCDLRNDQTLHVLVCPSDKLHIFVNVRGEKTIGLDVKCWYTVADIKLMIETLEGLPAFTQILSRFQSGYNMELTDSQTLQNQHIKNNGTLMLQENVQIFVKTLEGKTLAMVLKKSDPTQEIISRIEDKLQIKDDVYYLCYRGRVMSPGDTLQKHQIERNSTIDIRIRNSRLVKEKPKNT